MAEPSRRRSPGLPKIENPGTSRHNQSDKKRHPASSRVDEVHHLDFALAEREMYETAKTQSRTLLEEAISSGNQGSKTFNALRLLNILRLICNHGLLAQSAMEKKLTQGPVGAWFQKEAPDSFYSDILAGAITCSNCCADLLEDLIEGSPTADLEAQGQIAPCLPMLCERCSSQLSRNSPSRMPLNPCEPVESAELWESSGPAKPAEDDEMTSPVESMSTKIKALMADLVKHHATEKRFTSYETLSLPC